PPTSILFPYTTLFRSVQRRGELAKASEIQYGRIPELEKKLAALEENARKNAGATRRRLLRQEVTEEDIAQVVSSWTGIPVSRLRSEEHTSELQSRGHL